MSDFYAIENQWVEPNKPQISLHNRLYKYGDGFFESMLIHNGAILHLASHFERLQISSKLLKIKVPLWLTERSLRLLLLQKCETEGLKTARVRLSIYRESPGYYAPAINDSIAILELNEHPIYTWSERGLKLCAFKELVKDNNYTSMLKTCNSLTYVMAGIHAAENHADAALIFNQEQRIAEAHHSNVFLYNKNSIVTPPISEYCVNGVMRKVVMNIAKEYGYEVYEQPFTELHLTTSDEVFLTNATQGIQWVREYNGKPFKNNVSKNLFGKLLG
ncbi:MAG: aminotransferase class IV [Bacteroidia bacterium]|nr:aminotransferase class IV [Bacteroidia bacterium]